MYNDSDKYARSCKLHKNWENSLKVVSLIKFHSDMTAAYKETPHKYMFLAF